MRISYAPSVLFFSFFIFIAQSCQDPNAQQIAACHPCKHTDEASTLRCLNSLPKERISEFPQIRDELKKHKNYISLTTSPKRLNKIKSALSTLDLEFIENILLVLPLEFGRDGSKYTIPDEIRDFPKLKIIRMTKDLGPISKLLGVFHVDNVVDEDRDFAKSVIADQDSVIITIDDDAGYTIGTVSQLLKTTILQDAPSSPAGQNADYWKIDRANQWKDTGPECNLSAELTKCDALEGFGAIAYKVKHITKTMETMLKISAYSRECLLSDDFVISYALSKADIPRWRIHNQYIYLPHLLSYGFESDALHKIDCTTKKYQKCMLEVLAH